jgi:electron transport complex protein RnfB
MTPDRSLSVFGRLTAEGLQTTVFIDDRCTACGLCLMTCPERALLVAPLRPAVVDERCTGCLACIEVCPRDAITEMHITEVPA